MLDKETERVGVGTTTAVIVSEFLQPDASETVMVYKPVCGTVGFAITGAEILEVKDNGPSQ
jgi:hypothetical protein